MPGPRCLNVTSSEKEGRGSRCPADVERRKRHRDEAAKKARREMQHPIYFSNIQMHTYNIRLKADQTSKTCI
jgi:hypothetical protein